MISTNDFQVKVELHFPAYTRISTYPGFTKLDLDTVENSLQTFKEEFSSFFCTKCNFLYDYRNNKVSLKIKSKLSEEEIDNFCKYTIDNQNVSVLFFQLNILDQYVVHSHAIPIFLIAGPNFPSAIEIARSCCSNA